MTHLSLFSGIGGLDVAAEWAGFETVGQCEWADYPRKVLEKHWPGLPRWRDIRTLTKESFYEQTGLQSVTVLSGGFPCQPFSTAGKRRGKEDDRYLWPEMLRVIQDIQPRWVVGENVAGIVSMELDTVLSDLEKIGYTCQAFIIPACAVDAPHRRDRCAIVAYSSCNRLQGGEINSKNWIFPNEQLPRFLSLDPWAKIPKLRNDRSHHGVPFRVDRLRCLGNAVVPQQFYPIFRAIAEIERMIENA